MNPELIKTTWRWFFLAAALEAGAAVVALLRIPSEGLSLARLAMLAFLGFGAAAGLVLALRPSPGLQNLVSRLSPAVAGIFALVIGLALFLLRYLEPERMLPVYVRLSPLLFFLLLFSLQACILLLVLRRGFHPGALASLRTVLFPWLFFLLVLSAVLLLVSISRLGLTPDPAYWGEPGVPIQGWQFIIALLIGLLAFLLSDSGKKSSRLPALLPVLIYLAALLIWLSVPADVLKNGFYVSVHPPSQQPFPYSDSAYYDSMAQSLFIGQP
ncbi:MAG TPA: hypothetical protein VIV15_00250, partial [Anaerolineales bacterium]